MIIKTTTLVSEILSSEILAVFENSLIISLAKLKLALLITWRLYYNSENSLIISISNNKLAMNFARQYFAH